MSLFSPESRILEFSGLWIEESSDELPEGARPCLTEQEGDQREEGLLGARLSCTLAPCSEQSALVCECIGIELLSCLVWGGSGGYPL